MKVALVHWRLYNVGGLESRLRNYIDFFHNRGDEVTVFCYKQSPNFYIPEGVSVRQVNLGAMPKPYRFWYFHNKLQRLFNPDEFDFSLTLQRTGQQDACLAPGDHLGFLKAIGRLVKKPKDIVQINLDKISFANSKIIFPCSELVKQNLVELYGVDESKMTTLRPPLNTEKFNSTLRENREELRAKFGMSGSKKTFVIASTAHRRKGIPLLLRAFRRLKDFPVELKIAGKPRVRSRLDNVEYLGYSKDTAALFTAADFVIHPAKYEPFGQVISESLACGTPVLISENTGWSPELPTAYGHVVNGFKVDTWVEAIKNIVSDKFSIPENFAQQHGLTLEQHMAKMLEVFHEQVR